MNREVQSVMLMLLGGATLRISMSDIMLRYVKDSMRPYLIATGVLLIMLGIWALVDVIKAHRRESAAALAASEAIAEADYIDDDGHAHGHMRIAWLLLLPVCAILLVAPPALGAFTAEREQSTVLAPTDIAAFDPLPAGDPVPLMLSDYAVRAIWDDSGSLNGRTVELTGFVTPAKKDPAAPNATWYLTRLSLTCCAADAVATKVLAVGAPNLPANTWVTLEGTYLPGGGTNSDSAVPWIKAGKITQIPQPKNPYE